jgi:electron transport complex protein RnfC
LAKTFPKGFHPHDCKEISRDIEITVMPAPKVVYIPAKQHLGAPAEIVVAAGDHVKKGQLLAKATSFVSANTFSSVSGTVKGIETRQNATGLSGPHIVIENDDKETEELLPKLQNPSAEQIIERVKTAGIVGMGGASFPTHVKLSPPSDKVIDSFLINAAECEPYITCDFRIMVELTEKFVAGAKLMAKALNVSNIYVGIEENKPEAIEALRAYEDENFHVEALKCKYPQGAEKQLIYSCLRRVVPVGCLPSEVGCVVSNVHTALSVFEAVVEGKACYERIMTVSGTAVVEPKNMWVRTGTTYEEVLNHCNGLKEDKSLRKIVSGGPMMGFAVSDVDVSVDKATSSILFLTEDETFTDTPSACISCRKCVNICPMRLMPLMIDACVEYGDYEGAKRYNIGACIECGCCAYICPAKRPMVSNFRVGKKVIRERGI